jgi:predicted nuclease of predicted toxin-antitoxin system
MKLLLDQNISYKAIKSLSPYFTEVVQVGRVGMGQTEDAMIWQYALTHEYILLTFDAYFQNRNIQAGHPLKIIRLYLTNNTVSNVIRLITENIETIRIFGENPAYSCLELRD